jgi:nicotinamidase-related amidase
MTQNGTLNLPLPVQYFCDGTPPGVPCREENFERRELQFVLPVAQTALVLVDLWNVHHIDSWVERETTVMREVILPVIAGARPTGLTIVQAPSPEVIRNQERLQKRVHGGWTDPDQNRPAADWPPPGFRSRVREYEPYRHPSYQPPDVRRFWDTLDTQLDISPLVELQESDFVVATGEQLHALLREREILHIFYAGFATNWCIMGRDYGVAAMHGRGYNVILLRDATEGVEFPDTLEEGWATELAVREVEQKYGFTATSRDFLAACDAASA